MAELNSEGLYDDLSHTVFPKYTDDTNNHPYMSDVSGSLRTYVNQYMSYYAAGNLTQCNELLTEHPELINCLFNADKYNWMRDAIVQVQRYYKQDMQQFVQDVAAATIGINDSATGSDLYTNAYSAAKTNEVVAALIDDNVTGVDESTHTYSAAKINEFLSKAQFTITLNQSSWALSGTVYKLTVSKTGLSASKNYDMISALTASSNLTTVKAYLKAFGCIYLGVTANNSVTFYAYKQPATTIDIILEER